jgi:UMF1 family MFS transporter
MTGESGESGRAGRWLALGSWCLYDWANSAFPTVVETFVFSVYFARVIAADVETGTAQWGYALSLCGLIVALGSPILGAIADRAGPRKPWILVFTVACAGATALLWYAKPGVDSVLWTLICFGVGTAAFEFGTVFYNAMLPDLVSPSRIGRLSGWGWGLGYSGGLACLVLSLLAFIRAEPPPFGLDPGAYEPVRATALVVAVWVIAFAIPLFAFTPDRQATGVRLGQAVREGVAALVLTMREIRHYAHIIRFLVARMIYTDGLNTVFTFGGIYAAGTFGMTVDEVILFGIGLNVTAGLGAVLFAWVDDWIGPKPTIVFALIGLLCVGTALLLIETKTAFWILGMALGVFFGPAQAASRSMMAHLAPRGMEAEMFGLYALTGKATAFAGPLLLGWVTVAAGSQRAGMATALIFLLVGLLILLTVPAIRANAGSAESRS